MPHDTDETDLFAYPHVPGSKGGETSAEAAASMIPHTGRLQKLVLDAVTAAGPHGLTVVELAERDGIDRMAIQPRFSELRHMGKIADSGLRRRNPSGRRVTVWTLRQFVRAAPEREAA